MIVVVVLVLSFLGFLNGFDLVFFVRCVLFFILIFVILFFYGMIIVIVMGFVIGFLESIKGGRSIEVVCVFVFLSFVVGFFKGFGKFGIVFGGFCGYVIFMFYILLNLMVRVCEILVVVVFFCLFLLEKIVKL